MKKITATILLALITVSVFAQTDPIISGAVKYLRKDLKDPASYIGYGAKKYSWRLSDSLKHEFSNIEPSVQAIEHVYGPMIERERNELLFLKNNLDREKIEFLNSYKDKVKSIKDEYELYSQYSDSIKFVLELEKLKTAELNKLQTGLITDNRLLEKAKSEEDVYDIKRYTEEIEKAKRNIENIDEHIKTTFDYQYRSNIISNYIKFKNLEKEYLIANSYLEIMTSDSSKIAEIYERVNESGYQYSTLGYYLEKVERLNKTIRRFENKQLECDIMKKRMDLISSTLKGLEKNPQLNKVLYYYVVIDYSATNTYGGRIRDKETVNYRKGEYWID